MNIPKKHDSDVLAWSLETSCCCIKPTSPKTSFTATIIEPTMTSCWHNESGMGILCPLGLLIFSFMTRVYYTDKNLQLPQGMKFQLVYSYGYLLVITGYKWDYTFYKWGYKYLIKLVKGHNSNNCQFVTTISTWLVSFDSWFCWWIWKARLRLARSRAWATLEDYGSGLRQGIKRINSG